jgi:hypothetical protein
MSVSRVAFPALVMHCNDLPERILAYGRFNGQPDGGVATINVEGKARLDTRLLYQHLYNWDFFACKLLIVNVVAPQECGFATFSLKIPEGFWAHRTPQQDGEGRGIVFWLPLAAFWVPASDSEAPLFPPRTAGCC